MIALGVAAHRRRRKLVYCGPPGGKVELRG
jgi:hypothetical protein